MITFDQGRLFRSCTSCGGCGYVIMGYERSDFDEDDPNNIRDCIHCEGTGQILARRTSDWPKRLTAENGG